MATRELSLSERIEAVREERKIQPPIHFSLVEILQHYKETFATINEQFLVADKILADGNAEACETIWRSQIVLSEGLLDFYIHEVSKFCLFQMFTGQWERSKKYESLMVPMSAVEEGLAVSESKDWFFNFLNNRFSREVYLSLECMRDQLNLIGIGFTPAIERAFSEKNGAMEYGKKRIKEMFERRNAIAH